MLCSAGTDGELYGGVLRMLDVLLSHETNEAEERRILQDDYDIQMTQAMETEALKAGWQVYQGLLEKQS